MYKSIIHDIAAIAQKLDILDELKYRDYCIREEYESLYENRKSLSLSGDQIELKLGEKYALSQDSIHRIILKRK